MNDVVPIKMLAVSGLSLWAGSQQRYGHSISVRRIILQIARRESRVSHSWFTHGLFFSAAVGMLVAAFLIDPVARGGEQIRFLGVTFPEVCLFKSLTGLPCPFCGVTRSSIAVVHARLRLSFAHHPLGWMSVAYILLQTIRHGAWLSFRTKRSSIENGGRLLDWGLVGLAVIFFIMWIPILLFRGD